MLSLPTALSQSPSWAAARCLCLGKSSNKPQWRKVCVSVRWDSNVKHTHTHFLFECLCNVTFTTRWGVAVCAEPCLGHTGAELFVAEADIRPKMECMQGRRRERPGEDGWPIIITGDGLLPSRFPDKASTHTGNPQQGFRFVCWLKFYFQRWLNP